MPDAEDLGVSSVEEVLSDLLNITGITGGREIRFTCPDPNHADDDPSCYINSTTGFWNCFSCPAKGDLATLVCLVLDVDRKKALELLRPENPDAILASVQARSRKRKHAAVTEGKKRREKHVSPIPPPDEYEMGPLTELRKRGFRKSTLRKWKVRYVPSQPLVNPDTGKTFTITDSIGIPIMDEDGETVLAWCYRRTKSSGDWQPKYLNTPGVEMAELAFGMDRYGAEPEIVAVEGALDAMWLDQNGIPAIGIMGSNSKNPKRIERLSRFKKVVIVADRDNAGRNMVDGLGSGLTSRGVPVFVARYLSFSVGSDPQELSGVDLELMVERAIPFRIWKRGGSLLPAI